MPLLLAGKMGIDQLVGRGQKLEIAELLDEGELDLGYGVANIPIVAQSCR